MEHKKTLLAGALALLAVIACYALLARGGGGHGGGHGGGGHASHGGGHAGHGGGHGGHGYHGGGGYGHGGYYGRGGYGAGLGTGIAVGALTGAALSSSPTVVYENGYYDDEYDNNDD